MKVKRFNRFLAFLLALACIAVGAFCGAYLYLEDNAFSSDIYSGDFSVHFIELGNEKTGDCTYIKAGDNDILIDAGSRVSSIPYITEYIDKYVTDGVLEYVIVTHAHQDHYAGFATSETTDSIFDIYECKTIIDFAQTNQKLSGQYADYLRERDAEIEKGAVHYTAKDCIDQNKAVFELGDGITMTILDQKYYHQKDSSGENNHSVCTLFTVGSKNFLFTGDLEAKGEKSLMESNDLPKVSLYKAGHHGSKTSSSAEFMAVIQPEAVCVCCCCGSSEYTDIEENQFPTQTFIDNVAPYTDAVYVTTISEDADYKNGIFTSMNGNIIVYCDSTGLKIICSASDKKLKDTEWFKTHRVTPSAWS